MSKVLILSPHTERTLKKCNWAVIHVANKNPHGGPFLKLAGAVWGTRGLFEVQHNMATAAGLWGDIYCEPRTKLFMTLFPIKNPSQLKWSRSQLGPNTVRRSTPIQHRSETGGTVMANKFRDTNMHNVSTVSPPALEMNQTPLLWSHGRWIVSFVFITPVIFTQCATCFCPRK